jgi:hypothetical protein
MKRIVLFINALLFFVLIGKVHPHYFVWNATVSVANGVYSCLPSPSTMSAEADTATSCMNAHGLTRLYSAFAVTSQGTQRRWFIETTRDLRKVYATVELSSQPFLVKAFKHKPSEQLEEAMTMYRILDDPPVCTSSESSSASAVDPGNLLLIYICKLHWNITRLCSRSSSGCFLSCAGQRIHYNPSTLNDGIS